MSRSILDEYIRRRSGSAAYNPQQIQYGQRGGYSPPAPQRTQMPANQNGQVPVYRPNQWSRPNMVKAPTVAQPTTPTLDAVPPTDSGGSNVMTWEDHMALAIEAARQKVLEVSNRKFQYNASESPIYSIMRQEYLKEADLAAGRATAAAAQNAGGFGSSFAVMAGEEARRQVMEGFHDREDELYAAARAEQERLETESASAAAQDLQNAFGTTFSEKTQREYLASKGYSEADINAAMESQRKLASGTVTDYKAGTITDAVTQAQSLDEAYRQGALTVEEYDAAKAQNSKVIMDNVNKGMIRIDDVDHAALGFSDEEWGEMEDGEKKLAVFDRVGQLVKSGAVTQTDYYKLLYNDLAEEFESDDFKESKDQLGDVVDAAMVIDDLYKNGYLSEDDYLSLVYDNIGDVLQNVGGIDLFVRRIMSYQKKYGKEMSVTKFENQYGIDAFPGMLGREAKDFLMVMANQMAKNKVKREISKAAKGAKGATG